MPVPQRKMKRERYTLNTHGNGCTISPPVLRGLVLSGGGARGVVYAGMIEALNQQGKMEGITHVAGSSAGAMTASLVALGMSSEDTTTIVQNLNFTKLLDPDRSLRDLSFSVRAKGERFRNGLEILFMLQIEKHLKNAVRPLSAEGALLETKIEIYRANLASQGLKINSIEDFIKLTDFPAELAKIDAAFARVPKGAGRITFGDLTTLRAMLPEDQQHKIKSLFVTVTNQTQGALMVFGEANSGNSLADIVQLSGAHPILFSPREIDGQPGIMAADGGILDNMPTEHLLAAGLGPEEILCAYSQESVNMQARVNSAGDHASKKSGIQDFVLNNTIGGIIGGDYRTKDIDVQNREKLFFNTDNMLYLDSGTISVASLSPTTAQKEQALKNGRDQTIELLNKHTKTFNSPLLAMLYIGMKHLDQTLTQSNDPKLMSAACQAKSITLMQEYIVKAINEPSKGKVVAADVIDLLVAIENILKIDPNLPEKERDAALKLCLQQTNYLTEGKLVAFLEQTSKKTLMMKLTSTDSTENMVVAARMLALNKAPIETPAAEVAPSKCITTNFKASLEQSKATDLSNNENNKENSGPTNNGRGPKT